MRVVVPFDVSEPNTRLAPVLDPEERLEFALAMLEDVLAAVRSAGGQPEVLATDSLDIATPVTVDDRPLTAAVNDRLAATEDEPLAVLMADLPLATPATVDRLLSTDGDVVLVPGRGGGTNAIVVRHPDFRTDYHDASIQDHRNRAADIGANLGTVDSYRLSTDVDEPADLVEVLLHGDGGAAEWLREHGFDVVTAEGRVQIGRD